MKSDSSFSDFLVLFSNLKIEFDTIIESPSFFYSIKIKFPTVIE